ncbi:hypothetical protein FRX31_029667 [Thalictrum thalictroides]|uniref:Uncharacterized protein n=1 Tax=Thalictrum thalictroides TaxID=46969 RepID=A0A7J6V7V0_THATH|nr:hypothetical protein FRX31_029667 [Thalictrum thalictroides]
MGETPDPTKKKSQQLKDNKINKGKNTTIDPAPGNKGKEVAIDPNPGSKENAKEQDATQVEPWKIKKVYKPTGKLFTAYPSSFTFESGEPSNFNTSYDKETNNENQHISMPSNIPVTVEVLNQDPSQINNIIHNSTAKAHTPIQLTNSFALLNDPDEELEADKDLFSDPIEEENNIIASEDITNPSPCTPKENPLVASSLAGNLSEKGVQQFTAEQAGSAQDASLSKHLEVLQTSTASHVSPVTQKSSPKKGFPPFGFLDKSPLKQHPDNSHSLSKAKHIADDVQQQDGEEMSEQEVTLKSYGSDSELMCKKNKAGEINKIVTRAQALAQKDFHLYSPFK